MKETWDNKSKNLSKMINHLLSQVNGEKGDPRHQVDDLEGVVVRIEGGNPENYQDINPTRNQARCCKP